MKFDGFNTTEISTEQLRRTITFATFADCDPPPRPLRGAASGFAGSHVGALNLNRHIQSVGQGVMKPLYWPRQRMSWLRSRSGTRSQIHRLHSNRGKGLALPTGPKLLTYFCSIPANPEPGGENRHTTHRTAHILRTLRNFCQPKPTHSANSEIYHEPPPRHQVGGGQRSVNGWPRSSAPQRCPGPDGSGAGSAGGAGGAGRDSHSSGMSTTASRTSGAGGQAGR